MSLKAGSSLRFKRVDHPHDGDQRGRHATDHNRAARAISQRQCTRRVFTAWRRCAALRPHQSGPAALSSDTKIWPP